MSKFLIPDAALVQHVIALGKTRSGKSSKMRLIVERFLDQKKPVCIIDPKGDWWGLKSSADGKKPGYPIIIFGSEFARHADIRINGHSGAGVAELVATGNRPCLIDLKGMRPGERTRFFIDFASTYFARASGERVLVIDEVHHFAPQGKIPDPQVGEMLHWANRLVTEGGGMGITIMSASQRPQKVHKDYTSSHETLIACRVITKHDRDAIKDWIDACGDPALGKEVIGSLASMQRIEAWVYSPEVAFGPVRLTFPMFTTYDSFKPQSARHSGRLKGWASIDLKEVEARLTKVVEEAKANDPKVLRKEIADLKARLAKAAAAKPGPAPAAPDKTALKKIEARAIAEAKKSFAPLRTALEAAMKFIVQINAKDFFKAGGETLDQKAVEKAIGEATQHITKLIEQRLGGREKQFDALRTEAARLVARIKTLVEKADEDVTINIDVTHNQPFNVSGSLGTPAKAATTPMRARSAVPSPRNPSPAASGDGSLTNPQAHLLRAMAWWAGMGHPQPTRAQLAAIAGWKVGGSNMRGRLGELSSAGLVEYPTSGSIALTEAGKAAAPEPDLSGTLVDSIRAMLTNPQMLLFDQLLKTGAEPTTREDLGAGIGWEPGGSNMRGRLGELSSIEVIHYPAKGSVALQDWVVAS